MMILPKLFNADTVAAELIEHGYAIFPIDDLEDSLTAVKAGWRPFLQRWKGRESQLEFTRLGEREPDLGLRERIGGTDGARDTKYYFHMGHGVTDRLTSLNSQVTDSDWRFAQSLGQTQSRLNTLTLRIAQSLDQYFAAPISDLVEQSMSVQALPYSHAALRSLHYPAVVGQTGAATHLDRCLLTAHCGDVGGDLWARIDGRDIKISPPEGYAVIFFGIRILWVSGGAIKPLLHWSTTEEGKDRQAFVNFVPVPLFGYEIEDNKKALEHFEKCYQPLIDHNAYHWRSLDYLK